MTRVLPIALCLMLLAGCGTSEGGPAASKPAPKPDLAGAPTTVRAVYAQSNRLLDGGLPAYKAQLAKLRGTPVVVNKWASWCPPCRAEFPYFRSQASKRGGKVAFLGVDSNDNEKDARKFLRRLPLPYPSYIDGNNKIAASFSGVQAFPTTVFYSRKGDVAFLHQGAYQSEGKLARDIARYAR
jgi:cytochrome c biogenesis protein CcmG, thiol:disulfide interchange protein DsbE